MMNCTIPLIEYPQAHRLNENENKTKPSSNSGNIVYDLNNNSTMYPNYNSSPDQQRLTISQSHDSSLSLSSSPKCYDSFEKPSNEFTHDLSQSFGDNGVFNTSLSDDFDKKKKRVNRFFSPSAVGVLKKWFYEHDEYPYPDDNMTTFLAKEANISTKQVRKWFANKRVRSNKCYKQIYRSKRKSSSIDEGEVSQISNQKMINSKSLYGFEGENFDQSYHSNIPKSESLPNIDAIQFNYEISRVVFGLTSNSNLCLNNACTDENKHQQQDEQQLITHDQNQNLSALFANIIFYSNMLEMQKQYSAFVNQAWASVVNKNLFNELLNSQQYAAQTGSFQEIRNSNRKHNSTSISSTGTTLSTSPSPSSSSSSSSSSSHNETSNNNNNDDFDYTDCMYETDNCNKSNKSNENIIIDNYKNSPSYSSTSSILTSSPILNTTIRTSGVSANNNTDVSVKNHDSPAKQLSSINKFSSKNQKSKVNFGDVSDLIN